MVGRVEERGSADETQQKHADIQIAIEERQLVLDHITRRQYLNHTTLYLISQSIAVSIPLLLALQTFYESLAGEFLNVVGGLGL